MERQIDTVIGHQFMLETRTGNGAVRIRLLGIQYETGDSYRTRALGLVNPSPSYAYVAQRLLRLVANENPESSSLSVRTTLRRSL